MFYFWLAAEDNLAFTLGWFAKFPEYKKNKFYLTGESFSGTPPKPPKRKPSACLQDLGVSLKSGNCFVDQGFQPDILLCLSYLFIISVTK
jgi:hypothetical protein